MLAFTAKRLITPAETLENPFMLVADGKIVDLVSRSAREIPAGVRMLDLGDTVIAPGYIDLHIHGSAGSDVMQDDALALPAVGRALVSYGVTGYYPTTVTAPLETTLL